MKSMKYFILCVGLYSGSVFAQGVKPTGPAAEVNLRTLMSSANTDNTVLWFNDRYEGVQGHPFLIKDWSQAELTLLSGDPALTLVKMDICKDELWAILTTGDSIIVNGGLVKGFSFIDPSTNQKRTFQFILEGRYTGYFETLYAGSSISLLCKRKKVLIRAVISGSYTTGNQYDEFVDEESKYYILKKKSMQPVKLKESSIRQVLGDQAWETLPEGTVDVTESNLTGLVQRVDTAHK